MDGSISTINFSSQPTDLGRQMSTLQFFQPLTLQMSALVAAAIAFEVSEYATSLKFTAMCSHNEH
jgi:hypothetical protein